MIASHRAGLVVVNFYCAVVVLNVASLVLKESVAQVRNRWPSDRVEPRPVDAGRWTLDSFKPHAAASVWPAMDISSPLPEPHPVDLTNETIAALEAYEKAIQEHGELLNRSFSGILEAMEKLHANRTIADRVGEYAGIGGLLISVTAFVAIRIGILDYKNTAFWLTLWIVWDIIEADPSRILNDLIFVAVYLGALVYYEHYADPADPVSAEAAVPPAEPVAPVNDAPVAPAAAAAANAPPAEWVMI